MVHDNPWYKPINYLTSISCMTHRPVLPAAYMNFLLYRPMVPFTLSLTSILCTTFGPALPLYMFLFIYSVGLHCPQLSCIQLMGPHCPCTMNTSDRLMMRSEE